MRLKLFSKSKPLTRDEMRTPDPCRKTTDFSDRAYQDKANRDAGYEPCGSSDVSTDGTLHIFSRGKKLFRAQNGTLWQKDKP